MHAHGLHDSADRAARNDARAFGSRLHQHAACAEASDQLMRQRVVDERYANQILLGRLDALLDGERHFARLARAEADVAGLVADDDERGKAQILSALDHFGDAVDGDDLILQVQPLRRNTLSGLSHYCSPLSSPPSVCWAAASSLFNPASRAASVRALTRP